MKQNHWLKFVIVVFLVFAVKVVLAEVASSTNYQIESDSINIGGTELSSSTNYQLSDTIGESGSGTGSSTSYILYGGYRQSGTASSTISISSPSDLTLTSIDLSSGGTVSGTVGWTVTTDSSSGYLLTVNAATSPALKAGSNSFNDYSPSGANPDYTWSLGGLATRFGFSPEGSDITATYKDNGSVCGTGSGNTTDTCWDGFSTTPKTIASSASATLGGTLTTVRIQAEATTAASGTGSYSATITATATIQ